MRQVCFTRQFLLKFLQSVDFHSVDIEEMEMTESTVKNLPQLTVEIDAVIAA